MIGWTSISMLGHACNKAVKIVISLVSFMPYMGGPASCTRRLHADIAISALRYGAPVCAHILRQKQHQSSVNRVQRRLTIRVTSACKTISYNDIWLQVSVGSQAWCLNVWPWLNSCAWVLQDLSASFPPCLLSQMPSMYGCRRDSWTRPALFSEIPETYSAEFETMRAMVQKLINQSRVNQSAAWSCLSAFSRSCECQMCALRDKPWGA